MQDIKSITPINSNNSQLILQTTENKDTLFHDRAAIVARDIMQQIGLDDDKIRMFATMTSTLSMFPPIPPIKKIQDMIKDIEPLLLMAQDNFDPGAYIKAISQEKIEYFINQVITRLEWVKYGNNESEDIKEPEHENNN